MFYYTVSVSTVTHTSFLTVLPRLRSIQSVSVAVSTAGGVPRLDVGF
ncbi:hypothetical protein ABFA25_14585 [Mycobacterium lepromatosis]|nr:hypothetical protein [Mycobacterium lepromatosis]